MRVQSNTCSIILISFDWQKIDKWDTFYQGSGMTKKSLVARNY